MSRKPQYITTAIDYPNAAPHMGHVLEKVLADVIARWFRLRGDDVRFQIGTDEHGIKIQQAAKAAGMEPAVFVSANRQKFIDLYGRLGISFDEPFMHTSGNPRHTKVVQELWRRLEKAGVLEKRDYTAFYCTGCERFITKKELVDGLCPDHHIAPQEVTEQNWFFTLSKDQAFLKDLLARTDGYRIVPSFRAPETLTLLEQGLEDVSFSRPKSSLSWGIPVPGDENQTMYVWCDALTNYISGLDYFETREKGPSTSSGSFSSKSSKKDGAMVYHERPRGAEWWDGGVVTHVIGKDIARFHALIWPAMLHHAGVRTPDRLLIHGFLTSEGQKMSKSIGNVVVPQDVLDKYGVDAMRFYLSHEIPVGNDGDFSWKRFGELYDSKLRNQLGNLLNRVLVLLKKEGGEVRVPDSPTDAERAASGWTQFAASLDAFDLHAGIQQVFGLVDALNGGFDHAKPWTLKGEEKITLISRFAESLRHVSLLLLPFMPETAQKIAKQLNVSYADTMLDKSFLITDDLKQWGSQKEWKTVGEPSILFPQLLSKA